MPFLDRSSLTCLVIGVNWQKSTKKCYTLSMWPSLSSLEHYLVIMFFENAKASSEVKLKIQDGGLKGFSYFSS